MDDAKLRKYLSNDTVFNDINRKFISLQEEAVKENNVHLREAIDILIELMKSKDTLFDKTYKTLFFGGSFYKGTKISKPEEFDLDVIIKLPIDYNLVEFRSNQPGFTKIYVGSNPPTKNLSAQEIKVLNSFISNGYLNQEYFRRWVERIMSKVISELPSVNGRAMLTGKKNQKYGITIKKSGPAFTIVMSIPGEDTMYVDFVPALAFSKPLTNVISESLLNKFREKTWLAIPKPLFETSHEENDLYWRFSFYQQEKEILAKYGRVKPVIRHMKKLRDVQQWKSIASYFIETLFLNKIEALEDLNRMPLTLFLFVMLKDLHNACVCHKIEYHWDRRFNLLAKIRKEVIMNIERRLNNIVTNIERRIAMDPFIVAKYMLTVDELRRLTIEPVVVTGEGEDEQEVPTEPQQNQTYRCKLQ